MIIISTEDTSFGLKLSAGMKVQLLLTLFLFLDMDVQSEASGRRASGLRAGQRELLEGRATRGPLVPQGSAPPPSPPRSGRVRSAMLQHAHWLRRLPV